MVGGKLMNNMGFGVVLVACLAAFVQVSSAATSHTVGDSTGWTVPSPSSIYSNWASKQTFKVGDILVFNFQTGAHTVAEVSKSDYDACSTSKPISKVTSGPANVTISTAGNHYYICTVNGHCQGGQKLAITTTGSSSTSPSPSPKSSPSPSPKSSPSPAASKTPATSPTPSSGAATPTPSSSGSSPASSPSGSTSPTAPSTQSPTSGPSSSSTPPSPSSAIVADAGLVLPFLLVVAAFLF